MPKLFLIPIINIFDVHDVAVRDWLNKVDETALHKSRIMQSNYEIALNILGGKKPDRFNAPGAVIVPT